jgi:hypothetical protein
MKKHEPKYIKVEGIMRACYDSFLKTGNKAYSEIIALADAVPAADVQEVRHGRWRKERVSSTGSGSYGVYQCSICGAMFPDIGYGYNYCPNCGAKMDEVSERKCDTCYIAQNYNLEDDDTPCQNCGEEPDDKTL